MFLHYSTPLCTKEKTRRVANEKQSEREQVFEWLMADGVNSQWCPFLIKGRNFSFMYMDNKEHQAALKTPSIRLCTRLNTEWVYYTFPSPCCQPIKSHWQWLNPVENWGPSVVSVCTFKLTKDPGAVFTQADVQVNGSNFCNFSSVFL